LIEDRYGVLEFTEGHPQQVGIRHSIRRPETNLGLAWCQFVNEDVHLTDRLDRYPVALLTVTLRDGSLLIGQVFPTARDRWTPREPSRPVIRCWHAKILHPARDLRRDTSRTGGAIYLRHGGAEQG